MSSGEPHGRPTPHPTVSAEGLHQVERYLLPTERAVITTRRHWAVLAEPLLTALATLLLSSWIVVRIGDSAQLIVNLVSLATTGVVLRGLWKVYEWRRDWFVVTDERLLLTYGILTRRVAIMPLTKVTDMSYNISVAGRVLGYGEFVFESAGQEQALHSISYLARSQELFAVLSQELFGEQGIASSRRFRPRA